MDGLIQWADSLKNVIAIVAAVPALALSIYNWFRTNRLEREGRELLYASERQEALVLMAAESAQIRKEITELEIIENDASSLGLSNLRLDCQQFNSTLSGNLEILNELQGRFSSFPSASASHKDIIALRVGSLTKLRMLKSEREIGDPGRDLFLAEARRRIEIEKKLAGQILG